MKSIEVVRDNDAEHKLRMKAYADRNFSESKVEVGDTVVLKHENRSKLDPNFKPERSTVQLSMVQTWLCVLTNMGL